MSLCCFGSICNHHCSTAPHARKPSASSRPYPHAVPSVHGYKTTQSAR